MEDPEEPGALQQLKNMITRHIFSDVAVGRTFRVKKRRCQMRDSFTYFVYNLQDPVRREKVDRKSRFPLAPEFLTAADQTKQTSDNNMFHKEEPLMLKKKHFQLELRKKYNNWTMVFIVVMSACLSFLRETMLQKVGR